MNTLSDRSQDQPEAVNQPQKGKRGAKKIVQFGITLVIMTILLFARPQVSSAGGSCSTTAGDCSGAITLYLS